VILILVLTYGIIRDESNQINYMEIIRIKLNTAPLQHIGPTWFLFKLENIISK